MKRRTGFWALQYDRDLNIKNSDYEFDYLTFSKEIELYFDHYKKLWVKKDEWTGCWYPADYPCRSLKAAIRHLRKHDEIPKGTVFRLVSKYIGGDIYVVKK